MVLKGLSMFRALTRLPHIAWHLGRAGVLGHMTNITILPTGYGKPATFLIGLYGRGVQPKMLAGPYVKRLSGLVLVLLNLVRHYLPVQI